MSRSVLFHNRVIVHPGAEAYVDLSGMVQPGVNVDNVSSVVGEAPFGEPGAVHVFSDFDSAKQYFGVNSDLANAVQLLQAPSSDQRVDNGASLVYAYKANQSTQAEFWTTRDPNDGVISAVVTAAAAKSGTTAAYVEFLWTIPPFPASVPITDAFKNLIVEVVSGRGRGQQRQIASSTTTGVASPYTIRLNLRSDLDWTTVPSTTPTSTVQIKIPMNKLLASEWGTLGMNNSVEYGPYTQDESFQLQATYDGRQEASPAIFGGQLDPTMHIKFDPTGGGSQVLWSDVNNWHVPQALNATGTTTAASTATSLDGATAMAVDTAGAVGDCKDRWAIITGTTKTTDAQHLALLGKVFQVKDNTATAIELYSPGLGVTLTDNIGLQWKVFQLSDAYIKVLGKNGVSQTLQVYLRDRAVYDTLVGSVDLTQLTTLSAVVEELNEIPGITASLGDGVDSTLAPSRFDFGDWAEHQGFQSLGIIGTDAIATATQVALSAVGGYEGGAVFDDPGAAYSYPVIIARGTSKEEVLLVNDVNTDDLLFTSGLQYAHAALDEALVERISQGLPSSLDANWALATPVGTDARIYRFGSQLIRGPGDVLATGVEDPGDVVRDNCQKMGDASLTSFGRFTVSRATGPGSATYEDEIGACQSEDMRDLFRALYNGKAGTSSVQQPATTDPNYPISWEHGFDELLKYEDIRNIVPLASADLNGWTTGDIDTLVSMFNTHLIEAEEARAERQGYMGLTLPLEAQTISGVTYTRGLLEWIRYLNQERMSLLGQTTKVFTSDGVERVLAPWAYACQAAGIQLGTPLGEGLTFKYIRTAELGQPFNDWDPRSPADSRKALLGGLFFGEPKRGRWRVVRGQTTHIATDNLARTDVNVWEIRNFVMRDLRDKLEDRFTGTGIGNPGEGVRVNAPASIASFREYIADILEEYRAEGIIVDSEDESGQRINAWTGLSVRISGDIATVVVQVFPKTALNFILIDFLFQLPVQSA